jgi:propionyl-CoA carboxylase alpha chain
MIAFEPSDDPLVRWDVGIESGSNITANFDPMLAKVISFGETRLEAANKLALALENSHFGGMKTNRDYLVSILRSKEYLDGDTTTDFVERVNLNSEVDLTEEEIFNFAKVGAMWMQGKNRSEAMVLQNIQSGWNNARLPYQEVKLLLDDQEYRVKYKSLKDGNFVSTESEIIRMFDWYEDFIDVEISNVRYRSKITMDDDLLLIQTHKGNLLFKILPKFNITQEEAIKGGLTAPMPGKVVEIKIKKGSNIKKGDTLVILEAMKMEHKVLAPDNGKIKEVLIKENDQVENGQTLVVLD